MGTSTNYEVVGVARDGAYISFGEQPEAFESIAFLASEQRFNPRQTLHVRTTADPGPFIEQLRREVAAIDPDIAFVEAGALTTMIGSTLFQYRIAATMVGIFAIIGLILAAIGVYGVIAFQVARRTREFGIRAALGATASDIRLLVVGKGATMCVAGVGVGLILAAAVGQLLRAFLLGLSPFDPVTFVGVAMVLSAVALLASYLPARAATRVDPMVALRRE